MYYKFLKKDSFEFSLEKPILNKQYCYLKLLLTHTSLQDLHQNYLGQSLVKFLSKNFYKLLFLYFLLNGDLT
jgi:hypothetical protein